MHRTFPAVIIVARFGRILAIVIALALGLGLLGFGVLPSAATGWGLAALIAVAAWAVLRVLVEVVEVVADTLLPR